MMTVPATKFKLNKATGELELESPKQISIENTSVNKQKDGSLNVNIGKLTSLNDANVLEVVAKQNIDMMDRTIKMMEQANKMLENLKPIVP